METLDRALRTDILEAIEPDVVKQIISLKPFCQIDGAFNVRDLSDAKYTGSKSGYIFRSGSLERLTEKGKQDIDDLGIKTVVNLRSQKDFANNPDPVIDGVDILLAPTDPDASKGMRWEDCTFMDLWMLEEDEAFKKQCLCTVLGHIWDCPDRPFLLHCNAGKDRTGVTAALILALAGLPSDYISRDYALTRIGVELVRDFLLGKLTGGKELDLRNIPAFRDIAGCTADSMASLLQKIEERHGGVETYVKQVLCYSDHDVDQMRASLRG
ncbi:hypothetical protein LTR37_020416 [Vermiconidia calcicola]|uniref:Uncharacterized protein n=1 Tax=Vermiconidia calcicola TaxID=1690605 RepID=A0ACC3MBD3_9PEZI|nr:hypothetical protein LTR37_020416 [Vermiconidia calcicola]